MTNHVTLDMIVPLENQFNESVVLVIYGELNKAIGFMQEGDVIEVSS